VTRRKIEVARGTWGIVAIAAPRLVLARVGGDPTDRDSRVVMRILGARQAVQATLSGIAPTGPVLALGVWVDTVHAATAIALAAGDRRYSKPAAVDAVIAAIWAAVGFHDLNARQEDTGERRRSELASYLLAKLPGGSYLLGATQA
jgi:hypothetical protein